MHQLIFQDVRLGRVLLDERRRLLVLLTLTFGLGDLVTFEVREHVRHVLASVRAVGRKCVEHVNAISYEK